MRPIFDNAALIDWLAAQDAKGQYDYYDCRRCLLAQYLHYRGLTGAIVDSETVYHLGERMTPVRRLPAAWDDIAYDKPRTFGAALARAREALK